MARPLMEELTSVSLRPTETRVRKRDGQVLLERKVEHGFEEEVQGMVELPQYQKDQAMGLSRLQLKSFDETSQRWKPLEVHPDAAQLNAVSASIRVLSYNVWFCEFRQEQRARALLEILEDEDADIVCLQEVTPRFLGWLRQEPFIRERYGLSDALGTTLQGAQLAYGVLLLLRRTLHCSELQLWQLPSRMSRSLLLAKFPMPELELVVATACRVLVETKTWPCLATHLKRLSEAYFDETGGRHEAQLPRHLESDCSELRREQLREIIRLLQPTGHAIFAGDMNFPDHAVEEVELRQADFHDCTATSGYTMRSGTRTARLDRIYTRESLGAWRLVPSAPRLLGTQPIDKPSTPQAPGRATWDQDADDTDPEMPPLLPVAPGEVPELLSRCPSDHYGIVCDLEILRRKVPTRSLQPLAKMGAL